MGAKIKYHAAFFVRLS